MSRFFRLETSTHPLFGFELVSLKDRRYGCRYICWGTISFPEWVIGSTDLLDQSANVELDASTANILTENIPVLYIHNSVFQSALTHSLLQSDALVSVQTPAVCTVSYQKS